MMKNDDGSLDRVKAAAEIRANLSCLVWCGEEIGSSIQPRRNIFRSRSLELEDKIMEMIEEYATDAMRTGKEMYLDSDEYMEDIMERSRDCVSRAYNACRRAIDEAESDGREMDE